MKKLFSSRRCKSETPASPQSAGRNPADHAYAVILAGGSGSRLWPVSTRSKPKQFQTLLGDHSFLQMAYARIRKIFPAHKIFVQSTNEYKSLILEQLPELSEENVLVEPEPRDTGPAYLLALTHLLARDTEALASFFYADNIIRDDSEPVFEFAVRRALSAANEHPAHLITIGVAPKFPHTGLGYIRLGKKLADSPRMDRPDGTAATANGSLFLVDSFIEKPDPELAGKLAVSGADLWNTGYKTGRADAILSMMQRSCATFARESAIILEAVKTGNHGAADESFRRLPRISFEYLVAGQVDSMLAMSTDLDWSDAGDWDIIHRILSYDDADRFYQSGRVFAHECRNSLVISQTKPVVAMNLSDIIVIETGDAVLVMGTDSSQEIGQVLDKLALADPGVL